MQYEGDAGWRNGKGDGWKTGCVTGLQALCSGGAKASLSLMTSGIPHRWMQHQFCWVFWLTAWVMRRRALSATFWMITLCREWLDTVENRALWKDLHKLEKWADIVLKAESHKWDPTTPYSSAGWGITGWKTALQKSTWWTVNTWGERETLLICMAGEDRSRLFLQFSCDRTMGKRLKLPYETFRLCMRNAFSPTGPGCTERMWNLHPWKHWKSDWTGASTAGSGGTCLLQVFGLDNFQALLPISIILWFRCFFSAFVWKKENAASHS